MRRVVVLAEAAEDIEQAREFYDAQAPGVGDYCADSLVADIESLLVYHGIHSRHFGSFRMLAQRFPFGIYYRETETETQVLAVLDLRRDPNGFERNCRGMEHNEPQVNSDGRRWRRTAALRVYLHRPKRIPNGGTALQERC